MAKTETKIIEIRIDLLKGLTDIAELQKRIDALTASNKANDKSTAALKNQYAANSVALKDYRTQVNSLIRESANEIRTTVEKTGHIEKLKAEVSNLTLQYERLTKAELESSKGTQVLTDLKSKREELAKLNAAYGNHQLNVGNYSSATKMLGINIGQVMKEMPNFAISARIGIMSLTNNLPMLAETIKQVRVEQLAMIDAGKKAPSMFSLISKSVFGLTGIMSIAMVLMQIYGEDIVKWIGTLFKGKKAVDELAKSLAELNKTSLEKSVSDSEKLRKFAIDYNKATKEGNKKRIADLEEIALKEYGVHSERLKQIGQNVNTWKDAFKEYLQIAKDTYFNEALAKKRSELEVQKEILEAKKAEWKKAYQEEAKEYGHIFSDEELESLFASGAGLFAKKQRKELIDEWNKTMVDIRSTNKIAYKNIYSDVEEIAKETSTKVTQTALAQFDYESKIMEERAKSLEVGRERELAAVDAEYNAKLVRSQQHIDKLKQQEASGVKGAKEARIQAEKQQEEYELALEEGKGRKKIEIGLKYDKLQADNALAELKHQHDMMIAENELSAKEQYDLSVKYADDEYNAKIAQLSLMNISEEEYLIKSTEAWNQRQLAIANGEKKLTNDLYAENQARLNNELAALTTSRDAQFQDIDAVYNKKLQILNDQKAKEIEKAGASAELIKSIEAKYAAESVALEDWKITSKVDKYKFWADTALNVGSETNKAITAFAEHELSVWAKTNEGKANFDVEYEKKKIDLQRKAAIREKALGVMSATINTAASIIKMLADPGGIAGVALSVAAGITGAAQIAAILATPLPSASLSSSSGSSPKVEKKTVTEKFHTGGEVKTSPTGVETPATLLGGESVNTIATTQMFSPLLSALNQLGGGKAITSGVANTSLGTDMLASAFSKALRNMPAPILIMEEFEKASEKHKKIQNNRIIR